MRYIVTLFLFVSYVFAECKSDAILAVVDIEMSSKTARLVYDKEGSLDSVTSLLKESGCFNVIDWKRLDDVVQRNRLEWSSILNDDEHRQKLLNLIKVDYFIIVNIPMFSDDTKYSDSAFSKSKKEIIKVEVDLIVKNALTGEIVSVLKSTKKGEREIAQTLGFGAGGNINGDLPYLLFVDAIKDDIKKMTRLKLPKLKAKDNTFVAKEHKCKWIESSGLSDLKKGLYLAKKRALMDAYRNAVSQGAGVKIENFSKLEMSESFSRVYDVITKESGGFIKNYEVLREFKKGELYNIEIKACVVKSKKDLKDGLRLFVKLIGSPKVLVVIDQNGKNSKIDVKSIELELAKELKSYGFDLSLADDFSNRGLTDEENILNARESIGGSAIKFARDVGADLLISGKVEYETKKSRVSSAKGIEVFATINLKVLMPGSGKSVALFSKQSQDFLLDSNHLIARDTIFKKLSKQIAKEVALQIPKYLLNEEREIEIVLQNIKYSDLRKIKKILSNELEVKKVKSVGKYKKVSKKRGKARVVLVSSYLGVTVDDILDILDENGYNFEVEEATDYFLRVSYDSIIK